MARTKLSLAGILAVLLLAGIAMLVVACGDDDDATTTSSAAATTTSESPTTTAGPETTAGPTTSGTGAQTSTTGAPGQGGTGGQPIEAQVQLTGAEEVPPVETEAAGTFTLSITIGGPAGYDVSYKLDVENIVDVTAAHIHLGAMGEAGEVVYPLYEGPEKTGSFSGTLAEGTFDASKLTGPMQGKTVTDLATAVFGGMTYVNVHTKANPQGEIRGQISLSLPGVSVPST